MLLSREYTFKKVRTNLTGNQIRKHAVQMTKGEKKRCAQMVRDSVQKFGISLSKHVQERGTSVDMLTVIQTILSENFFEQVLEYNERKGFYNLWEQRVLFNIPVKSEFLCERTREIKEGYLKVVYSVTDGVIITAYFNECHDNHTSLNLEHYDANMLIRPYVIGGYVYKNGGIKY